MSKSWLEKIVGEVNEIILTNKQVKEVTVVFFDGEVDKDSIQVIKTKGQRTWIPDDVPYGGGTNFENPLIWIEENRPNPELVVFATDGEAPSPPKPSYHKNFIWLLYGSMEPEELAENNPWGKIIKNEEKGYND